MRMSDWSSDVCSSDLGNFNQFFWLWTPCNFADRSLFFHSNDDGDGHPWNRRAVIVGDVAGKGGAEQHFDGAAFAVQWAAGTRRLARLDTDLGGGRSLTLTPSAPVFAMSGLVPTPPIMGPALHHCPVPPVPNP